MNDKLQGTLGRAYLASNKIAPFSSFNKSLEKLGTLHPTALRANGEIDPGGNIILEPSLLSSSRLSPLDQGAITSWFRKTRRQARELLQGESDANALHRLLAAPSGTRLLRYGLGQASTFALGIAQGAAALGAFGAQTALDISDGLGYFFRSKAQQAEHEQRGSVRDFGRLKAMGDGLVYLGKTLVAGSSAEKRLVYEGVKSQINPYLTPAEFSAGVGLAMFGLASMGGTGAGVVKLNQMRKVAKTAGEATQHNIAAVARSGAAYLDDVAQITAFGSPAQTLSRAHRALNFIKTEARAVPLEAWAGAQRAWRSSSNAMRNFYDDVTTSLQQAGSRMNGPFGDLATVDNAAAGRVGNAAAVEAARAAAAGRSGIGARAQALLDEVRNKFMTGKKEGGSKGIKRISRNDEGIVDYYSYREFVEELSHSPVSDPAEAPRQWLELNARVLMETPFIKPNEQILNETLVRQLNNLVEWKLQTKEWRLHDPTITTKIDEAHNLYAKSLGHVLKDIFPEAQRFATRAEAQVGILRDKFKSWKAVPLQNQTEKSVSVATHIASDMDSRVAGLETSLRAHFGKSSLAILAHREEVTNLMRRVQQETEALLRETKAGEELPYSLHEALLDAHNGARKVKHDLKYGPYDNLTTHYYITAVGLNKAREMLKTGENVAHAINDLQEVVVQNTARAAGGSVAAAAEVMDTVANVIRYHPAFNSNIEQRIASSSILNSELWSLSANELPILYRNTAAEINTLLQVEQLPESIVHLLNRAKIHIEHGGVLTEQLPTPPGTQFVQYMQENRTITRPEPYRPHSGIVLEGDAAGSYLEAAQGLLRADAHVKNLKDLHSSLLHLIDSGSIDEVIQGIESIRTKLSEVSGYYPSVNTSAEISKLGIPSKTAGIPREISDFGMHLGHIKGSLGQAISNLQMQKDKAQKAQKLAENAEKALRFSKQAEEAAQNASQTLQYALEQLGDLIQSVPRP